MVFRTLISCVVYSFLLVDMLHSLALKIGSLNIQGGLTQKFRSTDIQNLINTHDIFCFLESWLGPNDSCPSINDYTSFRSERKTKHKNARRNSGGILIYCKKSIRGGVIKLKNSHSDIQWLKLDKSFFGLNNDIYLCICYIKPEASGNAADVDMFDILNQDVGKYSTEGRIIILGDLNSRVGLKQENHYDIDLDSRINDPARPINVPYRFSEDIKVNSHGRKLLRLLSNYDLLIANGRTPGDLSGSYTCEQHNGSSVVDLCIAQRNLLSKIMYFKVDEFNWFSDHASTSFCLKVNINRNVNFSRYWRRISKYAQRWNDESKQKFKEILSSGDIKCKLDSFCATEFNDSNIIAEEFSAIMHTVLSRTFPKKSRKKKMTEKNEFFSYECEMAKRIFKKAQRAYRYDKDNLNRRQVYLKEKRRYKKIINKTSKLATENKINKLADLETSDPKTFWRNIKNLITPRDEATENIDPNKRSEHFQNLLQVPPQCNANRNFQDYVNTSLPTLENVSIPNDTINCCVTLNELQTTVQSLKSGKSVYLDGVSNEVIKFGFNNLDRSINHLYNTVLKCKVFPDLWAESLIIPLHKKGDTHDVNNYRGIMISSCVGKLFLKILTKRIDTFMIENDKWCINQCGFKSDHRTEDSLFILQTIFKSYVEKQNSKIYIAFVDFSKFFDKINRQYLRYKLLKYGITGPVYEVIKSMFEKTSYKVSIGDHISPPFNGNNGVKQGCVISPLLSNIFQNDMHDIFGTVECEPISIGSIVMNSLSWADDLVIMSRSKSGLQTCLNNLQMYCDKWGLELNTDKTKTMVFSKRGSHLVDLSFRGIPLECVKNYNYLGFNLSNNGKMSHVIRDRINKSSRVANMVLQAIRTTGNVNVKLAMSIFDKQIAPILLYGTSIWSPPQSFNYLYVHGQPEGGNVRTVVKRLIANLCQREIKLEYTRRVGRNTSQQPRKILVKVSNYEDKEHILRMNSPLFSNFDTDTKTPFEKVHSDFCKRTLNITKFASVTAVMGELGRFPLIYNAWGNCIKYWLRLNSGTKNTILNEAYNTVRSENHEWIQSIQYLLSSNGFRNVWLRPNEVDQKTFHEVFKLRLFDQHKQNYFSKINSSSRFELLSSLKCDFKRSNYIDKIKNPDIRKIFTRLRIDNNILNDCKMRLNQRSSDHCSSCTGQKEGVEHFLLDCSYFKQQRDNFINFVSNQYRNFSYLTSQDKLRFILNLDCPKHIEGACCKFVNEIYKKREGK